MSDKYADIDNVKASKRMFEKAGVIFRKLDTDIKEITLTF